MGLRLSELYTRAIQFAPNEFHAKQMRRELDAALAGGPDRDIDVTECLSKIWRAKLADHADLKAKAYGKGDVSVPAYPGFSIDYDQADAMIADLVMPVVPGDISRKFASFNRRNASRALNLQIGAAGVIPEANIDLTFPTYTEVGYGEKQRVDMNAVAQSAPGLNLMLHHSRAIMSDIMIAREIRVANKLMAAANYASGCTSALSSTNRWDVGAATSTADPVQDIMQTALAASAVASMPNALVASKAVLTYLRRHPKVIAAAGSTPGARAATYQQLKDLFGLEYVFEGRAKYDTAGNTGTASYSFVWGKGCALIKVRPGVSKEELSFCKTFRHTDLQFRDEYDGKVGARGSTWLIAAHEDAEVITASDAGYYLDSVIS